MRAANGIRKKGDLGSKLRGIRTITRITVKQWREGDINGITGGNIGYLHLPRNQRTVGLDTVNHIAVVNNKKGGSTGIVRLGKIKINEQASAFICRNRPALRGPLLGRAACGVAGTITDLRPRGITREIPFGAVPEIRVKGIKSAAVALPSRGLIVGEPLNVTIRPATLTLHTAEIRTRIGNNPQ